MYENSRNNRNIELKIYLFFSVYLLGIPILD